MRKRTPTAQLRLRPQVESGGTSQPRDDTEADAHLCVVCIEEPRDYVLVPCGHRCVCANCARKHFDGWDGAACPICRRTVERTQRVWE